MDTTNDCNCLNCSLKERWKQYYQLSEKVILENPDTYRLIKSMLDEVCEKPIEIDAYFDTASRLSSLLKTMGSGTVFYNYFYENIDPCQSGSARFFRMLCHDLREQLCALNQWRKQRRHLRLIHHKS